MSMTKRHYEVVVVINNKIVDSSMVRGRDAVAPDFKRMQGLYPNASMIFVRQYYWDRYGRKTFRVLHELTVESLAEKTA